MHTKKGLDLRNRVLHTRGSAWLALLCVVSASIWGSAAFAQVDAITCGPLTNAYGPYDYTDPADNAERLPVVEQYHFTPDVESLRSGRSGSVMSDIDYTLRAFPNHHRALWAVAQLELRDKRATAGYRTVDCYFERAMRWRPGDATVRAMYAVFLTRRGDRDGARQQYEEALKLAPDNAEIHYNAGLLYLDLNDVAAATKHAERAYALGYPLAGLRNRLAKKGVQLNSASAEPAKKSAR